MQDDEGNDFNQQEQSDGEQVTSSDKYKTTNKQKARSKKTQLEQNGAEQDCCLLTFAF